jgi:hypothetical protein
MSSLTMTSQIIIMGQETHFMKNQYGAYAIGILLVAVLLVAVPVMAQGDAEPTDRPFPAVAATATVEPTDRPFPAAQATATDRPFPIAATAAVEPTASPDVSTADEEATPELLMADVLATADASQVELARLKAEIESLRSDLAAAQVDNGATTFALVIIVVGMLLALAVFFGLRRSGE